MLLAFLLIISIIGTSYVDCQGSSGPVGDINMFYINACDPPVEKDDLKFITELKTLDNDEKALDMELTLPFDIDEDLEYLLIADKWVDGNWQEEAYKADGNVFDFVHQYLPQIWDSFRENTEPKIPKANYIEKNTYKLSEFQELAEHVDVPQILYGRFRATVYFIKDGEEIMCREAEVDSLAKN